MTANPEIGRRIQTGAFETNYHDVGSGPPLMMIHGSGPGVSAWANWRGVLPELSETFRVVAPDIVGFGYTEVPERHVFSIDVAVDQVIALADELGLAEFDLVGNSFGGALALHLTLRHPDRVKRVVLMGAVSVSFELTEGLDQVWGYTPSLEKMRQLVTMFAYDHSLMTDDLVRLRYEASMQRGMDAVYSSLFPAPRQRWVDTLAPAEGDLARIRQRTLIIHGREDRIIPLQASIDALGQLPNADLLVFSKCGHWTQIERRADFVAAVRGFLADDAR